MARGFAQRLPSGRFRAVLWDPQAKAKIRKTLTQTIKSKREADQAARAMQAALEAERLGLRKPPQKSAPKWPDAAAEIRVETKTHNLPGWQSATKAMIRRFSDYAGDVPLDQITPDQCRAYLQERLSAAAEKTKSASANPKDKQPRQPNSISTIRKEIRLIARVFQRAVADGALGANPWRGIRLPPEPRRPPKFLTREQFAALTAAAPPERAFRYHVLVATGARREEAWRLRWSDIDGGAVRIQTARKGAQPRYPVRAVPIPPDLAEALDARRGDPGEAVFPIQNNWLRDLRVDLKHAKLPLSFTIHTLRHTFGSWLAQAGISLHRIRDLMGHTSITTTEQYAHLAPASDADVAAVFGPHPGHAATEKAAKQAA